MSTFKEKIRVIGLGRLCWLGVCMLSGKVYGEGAADAWRTLTGNRIWSFSLPEVM